MFGAMFYVLDKSYLDSLPPETRLAVLKKRKMDRIRDKDYHMSRRLARHRAATWKKWAFRIFAASLLLSGVPVLIWFINACWLLVLK